MSDNKIISFPGQKKSSSPKQEISQGQEKILDMIQKNRGGGLEKADAAFRQLDDISGVANEPTTETRLRALESAVRGLATSTDAINHLIDIVAKDLVTTIMNVERQTHAGIYQGLHVQTLLDTLKEKNLLTQEELEKNWKKLQEEMANSQQESIS